MNRREKKLLRTAINVVAHHNRNAWWELKRQIWEGGYASYYPAAGDFDAPARRVVTALPSDTKAALVAEWRLAIPARGGGSESEILASYARMIVEEVIERARLAAYRTVNW